MQEYIIGSAEAIDELIPEGESIAVRAGRRTIAVFNLGQGRFHALANTCPHKGASLCEGKVEVTKKVVRCPWHLWNWSLESGEFEVSPEQRIPSFDVTVVDGKVVLYA